MISARPLVRRPSSASSRRLLAGAVACLFAASLDAQTLLSHYTLDGNGTDTGTVGVNGTPTGSAAYGASGSGVGIFDQALSSPGGTNDYFTAATADNAAFALDAITIALWVKIDSTTSSQIDRLVSNVTGSSGFDFTISKTTAGAGAGGADLFEFSFGFNGPSTRVTSADSQYVSDKWLFLAVTYDSANAADNVKFYSGSETTNVLLNDTLTSFTTGSIAISSSALEIGGTPASTGDRSPTALFNDVRIYSGALTLSELETLRADVVPVPEPSQYALLFGAASLGAIALRRRRA